MSREYMALSCVSRRAARVTPMLALATALCLGAMVESAQPRGGTSAPGAANKYEGVKALSWNGLELHLWTVPSLGLIADKVVAPDKAATGWRRCEPSNGEQTSLEQCVGALGR
jgi:hypothetical protein